MKFDVGETVLVIPSGIMPGTVIEVSTGLKLYLVRLEDGDMEWYSEKDLEAY